MIKAIGNGAQLFVDGAEGYFPEEFIVRAVAKQLPKKVIEQAEPDSEYIDYVCPKCKVLMCQKHKLVKGKPLRTRKCCDECGQALDWSGVE